jgi:hypothetical protein
VLGWEASRTGSVGNAHWARECTLPVLLQTEITHSRRMTIKCKWLAITVLLAVLTGACSAPVAPVPSVESPTATLGTVPTFTLVVGPPATPTPGTAATPSIEDETATPSSTGVIIRVEPTFTPWPRYDTVRISDLPLGQPGHYVNVAFGYWLQYPSSWYTGFGSRPLLASFSNLDPGTHNRESMRAEGCLLEITASTDIYGIPLRDVVAQLPEVFPNAQDFELDGVQASRVPPTEEEGVVKEMVLAAHEGRLLILTFSFASAATGLCQPAWEALLDSWKWITPDFAYYLNSEYGYGVGYPRNWHRFNRSDRGLSISSVDPTGVRDLQEIMRQGMLVQTDVVANPAALPLKEWVAAQEGRVDITSDILLNEILGVRVLREGPTSETQEMSGYFQGSQGDVYIITCSYPADREWQWRPVANAIIYSFTF